VSPSRALAGLVLVVALGAGLGLALQGPLSAGEAVPPAKHATLSPGFDVRTVSGLGPGPFAPILGRFDYGEAEARFQAARTGHIHEGQDMFAPIGTPLVAARGGVVVDRGPASAPLNGGRGNYIAIYDPHWHRSFVYMHMQQPTPARIGEHLSAGQFVGRLGCTGSCDGAHLHFEVRVGKATPGADTKPLDPLPIVKRWPQLHPAPGGGAS